MTTPVSIPAARPRTLHPSQVRDLMEFTDLREKCHNLADEHRKAALAFALRGDEAGTRHHLSRWGVYVSSEAYWQARIDAIRSGGAA